MITLLNPANPQNGPGPRLRAVGTSVSPNTGPTLPLTVGAAIPAGAQVGDYIIFVVTNGRPMADSSPIPSIRWAQIYGNYASAGSSPSGQQFGTQVLVYITICQPGDAGQSIPFTQTYDPGGNFGSPAIVLPYVFTNPRRTGASPITVSGYGSELTTSFPGWTHTRTTMTNGSSMAIGTTHGGVRFGADWLKFTAVSTVGYYGTNSQPSVSYSGSGQFAGRTDSYWYLNASAAYEISSPNTGNTGTWTSSTTTSMSAITFFLP